MSKTISIIAIALLTIGLGVGVWVTRNYHAPDIAPGASFTPVQASQFTLSGAGITSSQTTVQLASFKLPDPNKTPISMAMFGDKGYGVIEPQTSRIENISFTGVTQNANGSATLTGVSRGISFYAPYNASTTLSLSHSGGATFILTNSAAFYGKEFLFANNTGTSTAFVVVASTSPWRYDSVAQQAAGTYIATTSEFASIAYVNATGAGVNVNASETVKGISELSTAAESALGTSLGATGARLVLPASLSTSTPGNSTATGNIIASVGRYISQTWLDLTASFTFSGGLTSSGATTIAGTVSNPLTINTVAYNFPTGQLASSSVLMTNGSGTITWEKQGYRSLLATSTRTIFTSNASTTLASLTIPANTIVQGNVIKIDTMFSGTGAAICDVSVQYGSGTATSTYGFGETKSGNALAPAIGSINTTIFATSSTAQIGTSVSFGVANNAPTETFGNAIALNSAQVQSESFYMNSKGVTPITSQSYISITGLAITSPCSLDGVSVSLLAQ